MALTVKQYAEKAKQLYKENPYNKECYYDGFVDGANTILDIFEDMVEGQKEIPTNRFPPLYERVYNCVIKIIRDIKEK